MASPKISAELGSMRQGRQRKSIVIESFTISHYKPFKDVHEDFGLSGFLGDLGMESAEVYMGDISSAKLLTARIRRSQSWEALEELMRSNPSSNFIHLSAAIAKLPRLVTRVKGSERERFRVFGDWLMSQIAPCIPLLGPREISNVLGSIAKLGLRPGLKLLDDLCSVTLSRLAHFSGRDLGSTAWALAKIGYSPSPSWISPFSLQCKLCLGGMDSQALSNLLWAYARWDVALPHDLLLGITSALGPDRVLLGTCGPQALSNMLWGLARQRHRPDEEWMTAYWAAVYEQTVVAADGSGVSAGYNVVMDKNKRFMSASELSRVFFAAGKIKARLPVGDLMDHLVTYLADHIEELGFAEAAHALWGLSHTDLRDPGHHTREDVLRGTLLPRWYVHTKNLLDSFVSSSSENQLSMLDGQLLGNAMYAIYRIESSGAGDKSQIGGADVNIWKHNYVRFSWLQSAVTACTALMEARQMDAQALAVTGLCISKLHSSPSSIGDEWRAAFVAAVLLRLSSMNSAEVANVVCALSRLRHPPSLSLIIALTSYLQSEMVRFRPHELATTLLALAHLSRLLGRLELESKCADEPRQGWGSVSRGIWAALLSDATGWLRSLPLGAVTERDTRVIKRASQVVGWQLPSQSPTS